LLFTGAQHRQPKHSSVLRSAHNHVPLIDHIWLSYNGRQSSAILCCVHTSVILCLSVCMCVYQELSVLEDRRAKQSYQNHAVRSWYAIALTLFGVIAQAYKYAKFVMPYYLSYWQDTMKNLMLEIDDDNVDPDSPVGVGNLAGRWDNSLSLHHT
jgi:hypothetical protein